MIIFTAILVIFIGLLDLNLAKVQKYPLRVKYGKPDTNKEYLFVGTMVFNKEIVHRFCTVSLIAERWVLTAAHCLDPRLKYVRFGDLTAPLGNASFRLILKMFAHPSSEISYGMANDIGLVLIREIKGWTMGKLTAMDFKSLVGLPVQYAGFGMTSNIESMEDVYQAIKSDYEKPLQVGEGVIVRCEPKEDDLMFFPVICVAPKCSNRYADSASGDSGGPLVFQSKIIGVVSNGPIEKVNPIGSYTPISPYLDWITFVITANHDIKKLDDTAQRSSVL